MQPVPWIPAILPVASIRILCVKVKYCTLTMNKRRDFVERSSGSLSRTQRCGHLSDRSTVEWTTWKRFQVLLGTHRKHITKCENLILKTPTATRWIMVRTIFAAPRGGMPLVFS